MCVVRWQRLVSLLTASLFGFGAVLDAAEDARLDTLSKHAMAAVARQEFPAALAALREGSQLARASGAKRRAALFENAVCGVSFAALDFAGSLRACGEAVSIALSAGESEIAGIAELNRANFLFTLGDTASADVGLGRALSHLKPDSPYRPVALTTLGNIESRRGQYAAARRNLTSAVELASASPNRGAEAFAQSALGALELLTGRFAAAETALLANFRIRRLHRLPQLESAWRQLAGLSLAQGRPAEAIRLLQYGLESRQTSRTSSMSFLTWEVMGRALTAKGDHAKAREAFRRALAESKPWREEIAPNEGLEIAADVRLASVASAFVSVSAASGSEAWEAFESLESTRAAGLRRQILANRALSGQISPELVELVRTARNLQQLVMRGDRQAAERLREVEFRLRRMESENRGVPPGANTAGPSPADPGRLAAALQPGEVLISFLTDHRAPRIWALSRNARASAALPDIAVLSKAVEAHRAAIVAGSDARIEGHRLYRLLFSNIPEGLLENPRWRVVADGPLWSVPWAALVPSPDNRGSYLVESKSLELLPSAAWVLSPTSQRESTLMLAAGNAIHNRADSRFLRSQISARAVPLSFWVWPRFRAAAAPLELPMLTGSGQEMQDSCRAWTAGPCRTLSGSALTFEGFSKEISLRPAVIHVATHLLANAGGAADRIGPELGQDLSAIPELDRGFLALSLRPDLVRETVEASDVSRMYVPGSLIVLSACGSGQATVLPGAGLQGFGRAWLAAGARGVIGTLWPVSDETSRFFTAFYTHLSRENLPSQALRRSQLEALGYRDWHSKPRVWAAYMLLGKD